MPQFFEFDVNSRRGLMNGVMTINGLILVSTILADILLQWLFFAGWTVFFRSLAFTLAITLAVIGPVIYVFVQVFAKLYRAKQEVERLSRIDTLTGLANRRAFMDHLATHGARSPAFATLDIDFFKRINDRHGHPIGDQVLASVSARLGEQLNPLGMLARIGGEEFAFLADVGPEEECLEKLESARVILARTPIDTTAGPISVTISIGVAFRRNFETDQLYAAADNALYQAKTIGRNRIEVAGQISPNASEDLIWIEHASLGEARQNSVAA